jgi:hypothetical protein
LTSTEKEEPKVRIIRVIEAVILNDIYLGCQKENQNNSLERFQQLISLDDWF